MSGIVFFDGVCNLCNAAVRFIIDRDPRAYFRFASLQSEAAAKMIPAECRARAGDSIVLLENEECFATSTAALRIARRLRFPWWLLYAGILIPRFLRDPIYSWIARNRYRWFGKKDSCTLPTPELKGRFL
ncbi:MAG TPA: DCC1-like thiol-disulfide oxidoreductase family protein [bacterium]|nr:DCC1-like thiol-disulfide oxidoreductase family protein [bacterium]